MAAAKERHIIIVRLSAMGDVAMVVSVVEQLRRSFPDLKITILTRTIYQQFFKDIENIGFINVDFKSQYKGIGGLTRLARIVRRVGVTDFADMHDVLRTKILRSILRLSGVRVSVVDKGRGEKKLLTRKFRKELKPLRNTILRYCDVLWGLGFNMPDPVSPIKVVKSIPQEITAITGEKTGRWIGFAPFAQHKAKIYPMDQTCELTELLSRRFEKVFIFGGGSYEKDFAVAMEQRYANVVSVQGRIDLGQEMDLMTNLEAVVTMDSATMHIASVVGVRVVSVWGATHLYAGFYGFAQNPQDAVQLDLPCRPCSVYGNKPCMFKDYRCLSGISPAEIVERIENTTI